MTQSLVLMPRMAMKNSIARTASVIMSVRFLRKVAITSFIVDSLVSKQLVGE